MQSFQQDNDPSESLVDRISFAILGIGVIYVAIHLMLWAARGFEVVGAQ
jgi:hypothetical protein